MSARRAPITAAGTMRAMSTCTTSTTAHCRALLTTQSSAAVSETGCSPEAVRVLPPDRVPEARYVARASTEMMPPVR